MARAETIESAGETGIRINGLFSQHSSCCMELTGPLHTWPGLLSTTAITISSGTGTSPMDLHHITSYLHMEGQDQPQFHHQMPTLSSAPHPLPHHNQQEEFDEGFPEEQSGLDQETQEERRHMQGPLPDLLPQTERLYRPSPHHRGPAHSAAQPRLRSLGVQLRTIGDEFNMTLLQRANVPYRQDWRDACRALLNFITQTLSTLYRLT